MIRSIGTLGPNQIEACRAQWPAFREIEEKMAKARGEYQATRPRLNGIGIKESLARLDRLAVQHTTVRR